MIPPDNYQNPTQKEEAEWTRRIVSYVLRKGVGEKLGENGQQTLISNIAGLLSQNITTQNTNVTAVVLQEIW